MRAAIDCVDVVDIAMHVFGVFAGVLHRDFDPDAFDFADDVDDVGVDRLARPVEELDELQQPTLVTERFAVAGPGLSSSILDAAVQKRQFLQPAEEHVVVELQLPNTWVSGLNVILVPVPVLADASHVAGRHAPFVFLLIDMAVAADFDFAPFGQKVHDFHADAVQSAGGFVGLLVELATELQHGHHALQRRDVDRVSRSVAGAARRVCRDRRRTPTRSRRC